MVKKPNDSKNDNPLAARLQRIASRPALQDDAYISETPKPKRSERQTTFKQATVQLQGGERVDVVVKNLSATGARIEFFRKVMLTEMVLLSEPTLRLKVRAHVVWQADGAAGLHFVTE